jgi:hypothetical protein
VLEILPSAEELAVDFSAVDLGTVLALAAVTKELAFPIGGTTSSSTTPKAIP